MTEDELVEAAAPRSGLKTDAKPASTPDVTTRGQTTGARVAGHLVIAMRDVAVVAAAYETATLLHDLDGLVPTLHVNMALPFSILMGCVYSALAYAMGFHRPLWRYASIADGLALLRTEGVTVALSAVLLFCGGQGWLGQWSAAHLFNMPASTFITGSLLAFLYLGVANILPRLLASRDTATMTPGPQLLIVGAGEAGAMLAAHLLSSRDQAYQIIAFVDDDPAKWGRRLYGRPVLGPITQVTQLVERESIDLIAIAMPSVSTERISEILAVCQKTSARLKIVPGLNQMVGDQPYVIDLREVNLVDLLGRDVVPLRLSQTAELFRGKSVLVSGAAGSIGSELCRQLLTYYPAQVLALDNNETGLFDLAESLRGSPGFTGLRLCVGDITDATSMARLFTDEHPDIVYHAAAYKHVPLLEDHPYQAARVNVLGTWLLCRLARENRVERFVFISSDKAADPVNVLGASKRLGELLVHALAHAEGHLATTSFRAVRFGNVIGSRGSVVPLFIRQIETGGPVTVTDPETTRYFMTIPEACGLVITASALEDARGLFLLDMGDPVRIADVATKMIRMRGLRPGRDIQVTYIGLRPGERLHEALAAPDERLTPTEHAKIFWLEQPDRMPDAKEIEQWMREFEEALQKSCGPALRERLMYHARRQVSTSAHSSLH